MARYWESSDVDGCGDRTGGSGDATTVVMVMKWW